MASDLWHVTMMTIAVSGTATLIAAAIGIPLGTRLALREFLGKRAIKIVTYMMYGFPPVMAGLIIYLLNVMNGGYIRMIKRCCSLCFHFETLAFFLAG